MDPDKQARIDKKELTAHNAFPKCELQKDEHIQGYLPGFLGIHNSTKQKYVF